MMSCHPPRLCVLFLGLCTPIPACAQTVVQHSGRAILTVRAPQKDGIAAIALADTVEVTLQIEGLKGLDVSAADPISTSPGWRLHRASPAQIMELAKGGVRWRQSFVFEPLGPGTLTLQIEPLRYREGKGGFSTLAWTPIVVQVTAGLTDPDWKKLREQPEIETLPPPAEEANPWPWIAACAGLLGLGVGAFWLWRRHRQPASSLPPEHWAFHELDRLLAMRLAEQGKVEGFHTLLANVVRRYLERKFQLPARRRTTPEFLQNLQDASRFRSEQREFLRGFLERCDLAKFAAAAPPAEECQALAAQARAFIQETALQETARRNRQAGE